MAHMDMWYSFCPPNVTLTQGDTELHGSGAASVSFNKNGVIIPSETFNQSCNITEQVPQIPDNKGLHIFILVSYMGTFVFGMCGNSLVIYIIGYFSKVRQKSVANYYIWNLAFADELFILALPIFCWATYTHNWPFAGGLGKATCKLSYIARDMNKFTSIFTLTALSVDRALASCHYLGYLRTITIGKVVCVVIWLVSFLISTPYFVYAQTVETKFGRSCRLAWPSASYLYMQFWTGFQLIVGLIIPSIIILTSYVILFRRLQRIAGRSDAASVKRPSRRMTQTVIVIVVTFIICQIPYHISQFIALHRMQKVEYYAKHNMRYLPSQQDVVSHVWLNAMSQVLVFISSCCNPIIYGLLNENFSKYLKQCFKLGYETKVYLPEGRLDWDYIFNS